MFIPHILTSEEISIAPDEVKNIFNDDHCEELAFPLLLHIGEFGYQV